MPDCYVQLYHRLHAIVLRRLLGLALVPLDNCFWAVGLQPSPFLNIVSWAAGLYPSRLLNNVCWAGGRALALAPLEHCFVGLLGSGPRAS